ncbi:MAG: carbohydrate kinase family protein [Chloroflexota bacterium]
MESAPLLRYLIAGKLRRDFILPLNGKPALDIPGGSLIYSAVGVKMWDQGIGLIGRVGEDYPREWLDQFVEHGFDCRGIKILSQPLDARYFAAFPSADEAVTDAPLAHFSRLGLPYPKSLLGYTQPTVQIDSRVQPTDWTIRASDFPSDYLDATAAHIAPIDYLTQTLLPSLFRRGQITTITMEPSEGSMNPTFRDDLPAMLRGINALICSEKNLRNLYQGLTDDLWEMAERITSFDCETLVIRRGGQGLWLYHRPSRQRWIIPAYPARVVDPTGAGDAFCGGFLAGLRQTYDPLESALWGSVSASVVVEGCGPFYALDVLPGLPQMRLEKLREMVSKA